LRISHVGLIKFTGDNMDSGIQENSTDTILIVKGRFKSSSANLYGLFLMIFNQFRKLETYHAIVSSYSDMYEYEPHLSWEKYEEIIVDRKWRGNYNNSMTASIMDAFTNLSNDPKATKLLYDHVYNYDYDQMDIILYDMINRIIHDKNLTMETIIEELSAQEFRQAKESRTTKKEEESPREEEQKKDQSVILQVKPIVAPIHGKPIYSLRIGDRIMLRIMPVSSRENYYIDLFNLREEKTIRPIPATVVDIKASMGKNNPTEILTEISPGVYGLFIEEEKQVKLKLYDPMTDAAINSKGKTLLPSGVSEEEESSSMKNILILGGLFILILFYLFY